MTATPSNTTLSNTTLSNDIRSGMDSRTPCHLWLVTANFHYWACIELPGPEGIVQNTKQDHKTCDRDTIIHIPGRYKP